MNGNVRTSPTIKSIKTSNKKIDVIRKKYELDEFIENCLIFVRIKDKKFKFGWLFQDKNNYQKLLLKIAFFNIDLIGLIFKTVLEYGKVLLGHRQNRSF